jgi:hypothetical protein
MMPVGRAEWMMRFELKRYVLGCAAAAAVTIPSGAGAQLYVTNPDFKPSGIEPADPLVGLPLPGATPAEYRAHLIWNLRAGLNVAALQCQFSPYLRTVDNYNGILAHHAEELASAYAALNSYFKRAQPDPRAGQKAFDDYTTITYNNFSTLQAQYGFCQTASNISKEALFQPKGQFGTFAQSRMRELRNSLVPAYERPLAYDPRAIKMPQLPELREECFDKKNRLRKKCGGTS